MVERDNGFRRFYDGEGEGDNAPADNASAGDPPGDPLEGDAAPPAKETVATFESLPEELRNNKALAKFSGSKEWASEVAKAYVNAAGHLGRDPSKLMEIPAADDAEGLRKVLASVGLPNEPKQYKVTIPQGAEQFFGAREALDNDFLKVVHEAGVLPHQVQAIFDWAGKRMGDISKKREESTTQSRQQALASLRDELGPERYDQHMALARHATDQLDKTGELKKALTAAGLNYSPPVLKALARIGKIMFGEGSHGGRGGGAGDFNGMTREEARAKGRELVEQSNKATNQAEQRRLAQEADKFFAIATGGKTIGG